MNRPFGSGPTTPGLGDLRSPWLLTTYPSHGMILQVPARKNHKTNIAPKTNSSHLKTDGLEDGRFMLGQKAYFQVRTVRFGEGSSCPYKKNIPSLKLTYHLKIGAPLEIRRFRTWKPSIFRGEVMLVSGMILQASPPNNHHGNLRYPPKGTPPIRPY